MGFLAAVCFVALAILGFASPLEQPRNETCGSRVGCLKIYTGEYENYMPVDVCINPSDVRFPKVVIFEHESRLT